MSDYVRPKVSGRTVFFTVCLADRDSSLLVDHIERLRVAVRQTMATHPFDIVAWVTMPDHIHCVWRLPVGDLDYSRRWGSIKGRFTRDIRRSGRGPAPNLPVVNRGRYAGLKPGPRANRRECAIWQRRFWEHHIRDKRDLDAHIRYCWLNPVRHGLVQRPMDWEYSSIHRDRRLGLVEDWVA